MNDPTLRNHTEHRTALWLPGILLLALFLAGCTRVAVRGFSELIPGLTQAVFSECDPELARDSMPANLKVMEGLLKADPDNRRLLNGLAMGFAGYAMLFLEDESPDRASGLLLRAMHYGFRSLGDRGRSLEEGAQDSSQLSRVLQTLGPEDMESFFWASLAWSEWIRLNLDRPGALAGLNAVIACLARAIELDGAYFHGLPYAAMGSVLSAVPPMLGGRPEEARDLFEKALQESGGDFLMVKVYYARYYAVRVQDRALFTRILREVAQAEPAVLHEVCLLNAVARQRAQVLMEQIDDFFL